MNEIRLLIDLGNSRAKWVWARGPELETESADRGDLDALARRCQAAGTPRPDGVLIASVADSALTRRVHDLCAATWDCEPRLLTSRAEQGGVRSGYREPGRLGIDRWLAIVGAVEAHGTPVVVWDLGTAATLDAVDAGGQHLGGWIWPGPATMLDALREHTQLPVPDDLSDAGAIRPGESTAQCIARGVLAAQVGTLDRFLSALGAHGLRDPQVVITGGGAATLLPQVDLAVIHDPWLVFRGMLVD